MRDELQEYYERELTFLRQLGSEFAEKYPKIASRLLLEPERCEDPHVERMLEGFAFLAARIHLKLDDDFPEITEALLNILYPHYLRPIPSMTIVEFQLDPQQGKLTTGFLIPSGSMLYSRPVEGGPCKFRTCYDTLLWPLKVSQAKWSTPDQLHPPLRASGAAAALSLELSCLPDVTLEKLEVDSLRFYLSGEGTLVHTLYELLCRNCSQILIREATANSRKTPLVLPSASLLPLGFSEREAILPYPRRSFAGYRLLQEYFAFPEKFFFFELQGLGKLGASGFKDRAEIVLLISPFERNDRQEMLEGGVSAKTFRLACCPVINLFPHTAEPILLNHTRSEYPVVPDARRPYAAEIFSVDEVVTTSPHSHETTSFEPFYSFRHGSVRDQARTFWHAVRRPSLRKDDPGTDIYLSLIDSTARTVRPDIEAVTVRCTCSNRDLPSRLPFGNDSGDFELEGVSSVRRILALRKPTAPLRLPGGKGALWRLISHLSLNYLSLVEEGTEALQEILRLYNFSDSAHHEKQVRGIMEVKSRPHFARVISDYGVSFARGSRVEIEFDEEQFAGGGAYLFASILERFLGLYASMNSFSQLVARTRQRKEPLQEWPPRAGQSILM